MVHNLGCFKCELVMVAVLDLLMVGKSPESYQIPDADLVSLVSVVMVAVESGLGLLGLELGLELEQVLVPLVVASGEEHLVLKLAADPDGSSCLFDCICSIEVLVGHS